ncbi:MAG: right-handed parallel beta-helix repeat-containing protein [Planctomycetes bacterium]|nr:right-handed parallel beta-helix repeat-containing protein [Planctomycetota bacterium]
MRILIALFLLLAFQAAAFSQAYWIYPDQFLTLQNAIDTAADGDVILVRPGTYTEPANDIVFDHRAITVRSDVDGYYWTHDLAPAETILTKGQSADIVTFLNDDHSVLEGFTITKSSVSYSKSCIYIKHASPTILSNLITKSQSHTATRAPGIHMVDKSCPLIANNVITRNKTYYGGSAIYCAESSPNIVNNTITDNKTTLHGAIDCLSNSFPAITNTIVYQNQGWADIYEDTSSNADVNYCCVSVWAGGGVGNFTYDPVFVDRPNGDLHIANNSPCRYHGNTYAVGMPLHDFEDDPRSGVGIVDVGADQFYRHLYVIGDTVPGGVVQVKVTATPRSWFQLFVGLDTYPYPVPTTYGYWHIAPPVQQSVLLGPVNAQGLFSLPMTLPPTPGPYRIVLQALVGDRLTNVYSMILE